MLKNLLKTASAAALIGLASQAAQADPVHWTDWAANLPQVAIGSIDANGHNVGVALVSSSALASPTQTNGGINYWASGSASYVSAVADNAPDSSDIIVLNTGGTITVTFSESVRDPILTFLSWNGNHVQFSPDVTINYLSSGAGYFGSGVFANQTANSFDGVGELHGAIQLVGDYTSFSFTHTSENWHGFTVGVLGLSTPSSVPEPGALALLGLGAIGMLAARRRKTARAALAICSGRGAQKGRPGRVALFCSPGRLLWLAREPHGAPNASAGSAWRNWRVTAGGAAAASSKLTSSHASASPSSVRNNWLFSACPALCAL
jgi:hypothetical protein